MILKARKSCREMSSGQTEPLDKRHQVQPSYCLDHCLHIAMLNSVEAWQSSRLAHVLSTTGWVADCSCKWQLIIMRMLQSQTIADPGSYQKKKDLHVVVQMTCAAAGGELQWRVLEKQVLVIFSAAWSET